MKRIIFTSLFLLFSSPLVWAQASEETVMGNQSTDDTGVPSGVDDDPFSSNNQIPIDGGASILAAAGVAYGAKKYRDYRRNTEDNNTEGEE